LLNQLQRNNNQKWTCNTHKNRKKIEFLDHWLDLHRRPPPHKIEPKYPKNVRLETELKRLLHTGRGEKWPQIAWNYKPEVQK
jgi:hypothetical protein